MENNPFAGQHLGNKAGLNLTGYYKLYADKKKIRIVYSIIEEDVYIKIIAIGDEEN